jgi:DNA adenine methylase
MLAPWIIDQFPPHRIYTEVFGGAGSVLLRKPRAYAEVYNDLDGEVVNLFRVLQDRTARARLHELLRFTPFAREEFKISRRKTDDPVERARRLIMRSGMGFGSNSHNMALSTGFRVSVRKTGANVAQDWATYPDALESFAERFRGVTIENRPALQVLRQHDDTHALHYVDPPYVHDTRAPGRRQHDYVHEMTDDDHRALADVLNKARGYVVVSGYPSPLYDKELYPDWHRIERTAMADGARKRTEVLWINERCWTASGRFL